MARKPVTSANSKPLSDKPAWHSDIRWPSKLAAMRCQVASPVAAIHPGVVLLLPSDTAEFFTTGRVKTYQVPTLPVDPEAPAFTTMRLTIVEKDKTERDNGQGESDIVTFETEPVRIPNAAVLCYADYRFEKEVHEFPIPDFIRALRTYTPDAYIKLAMMIAKRCGDRRQQSIPLHTHAPTFEDFEEVNPG